MLTNADVIAGLVCKHMSVDPMVVQKVDAKATLLVLPEGEEDEKICSTLHPQRCGWVKCTGWMQCCHT